MSAAREALRVLVVTAQRGAWRDDLVKAIAADRDVTLVGEVAPQEAAGSIRRDHPDIVSLDMTGLDSNGLAPALVRNILALGPVPILLLVPEGQGRGASMAALVAGAVEVMTSPARWDLASGTELCRRLHALSHLSVRRRERLRARRHPPLPPIVPGGSRSPLDGVVGIAASTGGPPALARVLSGLEGLDRPVVLVQHLQSGFVDGFLNWMRRESALPVDLAVDGAPLKPGTALVAPPGLHVVVRRGRRITLHDEPVTLHRPSADILFHSMAEQCGSAGIGVILTGMGDDGAAGLLALRRSGGITIAQNEETSAVYGMPKAATDMGAVTRVLPLGEIAAEILHLAELAVPA
ncbi:MAG TPA: chemotaxis protein CheB [Candidatus Binatia bacterium]|nr:chemotaxis protein CheB [Candidatus Binatia bacterium]